jgi:hypothetical protein
MTLRIPVYYMIASGTDVESAQLMNALQKGWSLVDFARSYALNRQNPERANVYKRFLALFEEFKIPISIRIIFCEQRTRHNSTKYFKEGELVIKNEEVTRVWLENVQEIYELVPPLVKNRHSFAHALFTVFKHPDYDHDRMLAKLRETQIQPQLTRTDYLRELERIYNHSIQIDAKKLRFF